MLQIGLLSFLLIFFSSGIVELMLMMLKRRYDPDAKRLLLEVYGRWSVGLTIPVVLTCNSFFYFDF